MANWYVSGSWTNKVGSRSNTSRWLDADSEFEAKEKFKEYVQKTFGHDVYSEIKIDQCNK